MASTRAIMGLRLATNGTGLLISSGWAQDTGDVEEITSSSSLTINPANTGMGGLDTGSLAASTVYAVWLAKNSAGTVHALMSTAFTADSVTLPSGWSGAKMRRIGCCSTNASTTLNPFAQTGVNNERVYTWFSDVSTRKVLDAGTATTWTTVEANALTPESAEIITVLLVPTNATFEARSVGAEAQLSSATPTIYGYNTSNDTDILEYRRSGGTGSVDGYVMGFTEYL